MSAPTGAGLRPVSSLLLLHFLRVHRQYIINLNHVKQFNRNEGVLTMDNGDHIPIARNQKERLIERYRSL